jgi:hypothetical protein
MTVEIDPRPVLYIAADRPRQVQRSFVRMIRPGDRERLNQTLRVWGGPLPFDIGSVTGDPKALAGFALELGVGTIFVDSLKDVALDLVKDEVGSRVNLAFRSALPPRSRSARSTISARAATAPSRRSSRTSTAPAGSPPAWARSCSSGVRRETS